MLRFVRQFLRTTGAPFLALLIFASGLSGTIGAYAMARDPVVPTSVRLVLCSDSATDAAERQSAAEHGERCKDCIQCPASHNTTAPASSSSLVHLLSPVAVEHHVNAWREDQTKLRPLPQAWHLPARAPPFVS